MKLAESGGHMANVLVTTGEVAVVMATIAATTPFVTKVADRNNQ